MIRIPTLFIRDHENPQLVIDQVNACCQWVTKGEGVATRKWDGQPLLCKNGLWYKRYTGELGGYSGNPEAALSCGFAEDATPIWWVLVTHTKENKHILEAVHEYGLVSNRWTATYEICGPNFCHNRERLNADKIIKHGQGGIFPDAPVNFHGLKSWLSGMDIEGLVWHHPSGLMAKIKKSDFGLRRDPRWNGIPKNAYLGPDGTTIPVVDGESDVDEAQSVCSSKDITYEAF